MGDVIVDALIRPRPVPSLDSRTDDSGSHVPDRWRGEQENFFDSDVIAFVGPPCSR